ncbi:piggyBac transposable element-derived protein 4-like [Aphis craccivora]|uniref:PiggyBac transposable element-derived protein 4-like n=1 Tax=Aphis craccivora TaxID=307492 RepID=A0A6G0WDI3_APHCR|nr:piggyBac transposable element-derived protein 4-like [Aphis craccivora]
MCVDFSPSGVGPVDKQKKWIDKSMVKFKGRSTLKQYTPQKLIKRGYKIWMLNDKTKYTAKFQVYTGKVDGGVEKLLGERIVNDLMTGLEGKNHILYIDNYFTSYPLF